MIDSCVLTSQDLPTKRDLRVFATHPRVQKSIKGVFWSGFGPVAELSQEAFQEDRGEGKSLKVKIEIASGP